MPDMHLVVHAVHAIIQGGVRNKIYDMGSDFFLAAQGLDYLTGVGIIYCT